MTTKFFTVLSLRMLLPYSNLPYLQYIYITFRDCVYYVSQEEERMVLTNSDLFSIFNQRRGELNYSLLLLWFYTLNNPQQSKVKYPGNSKFFSLRHGVQRGHLPPKKMVLPFVACHLHMITLTALPRGSPSPMNMTGTIHSFHLPQYILNFFNSLFTWPSGHRNYPPYH